MRNIIVGFSSPNKFKIGAELIKLWIKKPYSHVYVNWIDDQGRDIVWQASHGCVHTISKENFLVSNKIQKEIVFSFTEEEYQKLRDFCYNYSGSIYSITSLFLIVCYDLAIRLGLKPLFKNLEGFICSELVSRIFSEVKDLELPKPTYLMRPDDVEMSLDSVESR
jgi:hypothetical protein